MEKIHYLQFLKKKKLKIKLKLKLFNSATNDTNSFFVIFCVISKKSERFILAAIKIVFASTSR